MSSERARRLIAVIKTEEAAIRRLAPAESRTYPLDRCWQDEERARCQAKRRLALLRWYAMYFERA